MKISSSSFNSKSSLKIYKKWAVYSPSPSGVKINYESSIKWVSLVELICGSARSSSRQARYHLTFITEGNTVGNVVG